MENITKVIFFFAFLIVNCTLTVENSYPQWISQYPNTPGIALRDIEFINRNTGWACGDNGLILKTTNGGKDWISQTNPASGTGKFLFSIHPVDSMVLYCVGYFQTILKTINGGEEWTAIRNGKPGASGSFLGVYFVNENTGWISGTLGRILKTTDGGVTLDSTGVFWGFMHDVYFKDANTGLISGDFAGMFKTTDGGNSWEQKYIPHYGGIGNFRKLSVINNQYVFVVEDANRVFRSTNFGDTWDSVGFVYGADQPYGCGFASELVGFVGGTYGEMFKTIDGGVTWRREDNNGDTRFVRSFWFYDELTGWAVGGNTKIFYTETGGLTGIQQFSSNIPEEFNLYQNFPNPFNPVTNIQFDLPRNEFVTIKIYDMTGREIQVLLNDFRNAGRYIVGFDASHLSSGVYFYTIQAGEFRQTRRMILLK